MLKVYFDEDVSPVVCKIIRSRGYDCASAHEFGKRGISDNEQLHFAVAEGRIMVTHNRTDYVDLAMEWNGLGNRHSGIVLVFQENRTASEMANAILTVLSNYDQADWINVVAYA